VSLLVTGDPTHLLEGDLARRRDKVGDQPSSFLSEPVLLQNEKNWRLRKTIVRF
jgi:hypothetical protein